MTKINTRGRTGKNHNYNMLQDLTNVIVGNISIKPLEGEAKRYFRLGYDLERRYTKQLMIDDDLYKFPFGEIEQILEVGLVKK